MTATYLPNALNEYITYTYNISIKQINPARFSGYADIDKLEGILIADNSVTTRFNIEYCEQTFLLGYEKVRSSFANRFDIKITEPNGITFFDVIRNAAIENEIPNITQALYLIEITFPARDNSNKPVKYPNVFRYVVNFVDIVSQIDSGGSFYNISAVEVNTSAYSFILGTNKHTIRIEAGTFGEALTELQLQLNRAEEANFYLDLNSAFRNEYKIELDENITEWGDWKFESQYNEADTTGTRSIGEKHTFNLTQNTNIHEFIGILLRTTKEWKRLPTADGSYSIPEGDIESETGSETKLKVFYKVLTEIEYKEYDVLRNDYSKLIKYKIVKHIVDTPTDTPELSRIMDDPDAQRAKIREYASRGLLRKKYEYLFTGKNTEVINLDLKFDMAYFAISPIFGGQIDTERLKHNSARNPSTFDEKVTRVRKLKEEIVRNQASRDNLSETGDLSILEDLSLIQRNDLLIEQLIKERTVLPGSIPVRYQAANPGTHNVHSGENDTVTALKQHNATIIANLENSSDLLTIEMNIRGDPYWLGRPNNYNKIGLQRETFLTANYDLGGNLFFLKVNLPVEEDASGRRVPRRRDSVITGLYRVIDVISQYRNGQFTQFLKAVRERTIDGANIPEELNEPEITNPSKGNVVETPAENQDSATQREQASERSSSRVDTEPTSEPPQENGPQIPTNANVAEMATQRNAVNVNLPFLVGVFGSSNNPTTTIKLPDGSIKSGLRANDRIPGTPYIITDITTSGQSGTPSITVFNTETTADTQIITPDNPAIR